MASVTYGVVWLDAARPSQASAKTGYKHGEGQLEGIRAAPRAAALAAMPAPTRNTALTSRAQSPAVLRFSLSVAAAG